MFRGFNEVSPDSAGKVGVGTTRDTAETRVRWAVTLFACVDHQSWRWDELGEGGVGVMSSKKGWAN